MNPAGLVPQGADNSGYAAVVPGSGYDIAKLHRDIVDRETETLQAQEVARKAAEEKRKAVNQGLTYTPAWDRSTGQLRNMRDQFMQAGAELESKGYDIADPSGPGGQAMQDAAVQLKLYSELDKGQSAWYYKTIDAYNQDPQKYGADFWEKMNVFDGLQTIEERQQFIDKINPLEPAWNPAGFLKRNAVESFRSTIEKGNTTITAENVRRLDVERKLKEDLKTPQGQYDFTQGIRNGTWKDIESAVDFTYNQIRSANPGNYSKTEDENNSSTWTFGGGGASKKYGNWTVSGTRRASDSDTRDHYANNDGVTHFYNIGNEIRQIDVANSHKEVPPFYLKTGDGKEVLVQITGFERRGTNWFVKGKKQVEASTAGNEVNDEKIKEYEEVVVPYSGNENDIAAKMDGFNVNEFAREAESQMTERMSKSAEKGYDANYRKTVLDMTDKTVDAMAARENALKSGGFTDVQVKEVADKNDPSKRKTIIRYKSKGQRFEYDMDNEIDQMELLKDLKNALGK